MVINNNKPPPGRDKSERDYGDDQGIIIRDYYQRNIIGIIIGDYYRDYYKGYYYRDYYLGLLSGIILGFLNCM